MPQLFVAPQSTPNPWRILGGTTAQMQAKAIAAIKLPWSDGSSETIPAGTQPVSAYGPGHTIDATMDVWLIIAVKGSPAAPLLVKEKDYPTNMDTITSGGQWARIRRIENGEDCPVAQV